MIDEKEFEKLKTEHNKVAMWVEYFSHRMAELEESIKELKKEADSTRDKQEILGRSVLKIMEPRK